MSKTLHIPGGWNEAFNWYCAGKLSGDDLILFADQCAPRMSHTARKLVELKLNTVEENRKA